MKMHKLKKKYLIKDISNMYRMFRISAKTYAKNGVSNIIDKEKMLWPRNKNIGEKLDVKNIHDWIDKVIKDTFETKNLTDKQISKYKRRGSKLINGEKFAFTHEDIIMPVIM